MAPPGPSTPECPDANGWVGNTYISNKWKVKNKPLMSAYWLSTEPYPYLGFGVGVLNAQVTKQTIAPSNVALKIKGRALFWNLTTPWTWDDFTSRTQWEFKFTATPYLY